MGSSPSHLTCCLPSSAGVTMKLMDEVAGIVAARHCKTNIVTASVDAINFHDKIRKGNRTPLTERGCLGYLGLCTVCFWFTLAPPGPGLCPFVRETEARGLYPIVMLFSLLLFAMLWTAARQASLSFAVSWSLLKLMSIELVMLSNHLIKGCPWWLRQ